MIQVQKISKSFQKGFWMRKVQALRDVSLEVKAGDLYGFIGPNGAGKSTTIKSILGLVRPDQGAIKLFGQEINSSSRGRLGYMPEQPYFNEQLSGFEIVAYAARLCGVGEIKKAVHRAFERVRAEGDWIYRPLSQYSKGMQQRVGLAQAIVHSPELLILDEPMSGLDPMGRRDLRLAMKELNEEGTTLIFSSHVLSDVETLCNRVGMIVGGEFRLEGETSELMSREKGMIRFQLEEDVHKLEFPGIDRNNALEWCLMDSEQAGDLQSFLRAQGLTISHWEKSKQGLEELLRKEIAR